MGTTKKFLWHLLAFTSYIYLEKTGRAACGKKKKVSTGDHRFTFFPVPAGSVGSHVHRLRHFLLRRSLDSRVHLLREHLPHRRHLGDHAKHQERTAYPEEGQGSQDRGEKVTTDKHLFEHEIPESLAPGDFSLQS